MRTKTVWLGVAVAALAAGSASAQSAQDAGVLLGRILGSGTAAPTAPTTAPPPGVTSTEASSGLKLALGKASERADLQMIRACGSVCRGRWAS